MKLNSDQLNVLLVNPNRMRPPVAPLGLELAAASLARHGLSPVVLDLAWEQRPLPALVAAVGKVRPAAVGISIRNLDDCYYASQAFLLPPIRRFIKTIKAVTEAPVILGGVGFSIAPAAALEYLGADFGIRGDSEEAFPRLVKKIARGQDLVDIPGLIVRGSSPGGRDLGSRQSLAIADLLRLPAPDRHWADLKRYFRLGGQGNIETQRGCNRKCIYCADPVAKGTRLRFRDPAAIAAEIKGLLKLGVHALHFCDSEFNVSRKHVEAVCREIIQAGLAPRLSWYTYALPAPMDLELARLMAAAGCRGIDFGVDAADAGMLQTLGRDYGPEAIETCARACRKAGIVFMYDLLLGGPGETRKSLAVTIKRMKQIRPDRVGVSFGVRVFPGTRLAQTLAASGPLAENPCLAGTLTNNPSLLKPVFYVSNQLGKDPEEYLSSLIGDDPRFFFASRKALRNYNYNNNRPLCAAIRKGARGAYWDILRRGT